MIWRPDWISIECDGSMAVSRWIAVAGLLVAATAALGQERACAQNFAPNDCLIECYRSPSPRPDSSEQGPLISRLMRYAEVQSQHRLKGLASYYSTFFDGRETANGEIYRNRRFSAAHLTLPLGCWIEVRARATGRKLRLRVNDRGPYAKKFMLDLSQAAARFLGVDVAEDRHVDVRIVALPGEEPLPEEMDLPDPALAPAEAIALATTPGS